MEPRLGTATHRVLRLVVDQLLAMLDPFFEHQWVLHTVDDLQKEFLFFQECSIGYLHFGRCGHTESGHTAHQGQQDKCQFHPVVVVEVQVFLTSLLTAPASVSCFSSKHLKTVDFTVLHLAFYSRAQGLLHHISITQQRQSQPKIAVT